MVKCQIPLPPKYTFLSLSIVSSVTGTKGCFCLAQGITDISACMTRFFLWLGSMLSPRQIVVSSPELSNTNNEV